MLHTLEYKRPKSEFTTSSQALKDIRKSWADRLPKGYRVTPARIKATRHTETHWVFVVAKR